MKIQEGHVYLCPPLPTPMHTATKGATMGGTTVAEAPPSAKSDLRKKIKISDSFYRFFLCLSDLKLRNVAIYGLKNCQ